MTILAMTLAAPALASSDGTLGPTSSGSFTINATVSQAATDNVQVFGLDDLSLFLEQGSIPGEAGTFDSQPFCIIRSPSGGNVNITISSFDAADTAYLVKSAGGASQVALNMQINNNNDGVGYVQPEGMPILDVPVSSSCSDVLGDPTSLEMFVIAAGEVTADPGIYSGSFLVTVAPN